MFILSGCLMNGFQISLILFLVFSYQADNMQTAVFRNLPHKLRLFLRIQLSSLKRNRHFRIFEKSCGFPEFHAHFLKKLWKCKGFIQNNCDSVLKALNNDRTTHVILPSLRKLNLRPYRRLPV